MALMENDAASIDVKGSERPRGINWLPAIVKEELTNRMNIDIGDVPRSKLGQQIGQGQCSEVFVWENSRVCKLVQGYVPPFWIENEYNAGVAAMFAGIPVPAVHEMVQIDNRFGIIFDRIEGRDMDSELISGLWTRLWKLRDYTRFFEDVQSRIHTESAPDNLISQHGLLEDSLSRSGPLPKRMRDAAVEALGRLPERGQLCHGDCHFGNVMLSAKGPAIIDWQNGNAGNPLGDMASTEILLLVPIVPPVLFPMVLPITKKRAAMYRHYCQKRPWFDEEEYRMHLFVAAAARIGNVFYNPKAVRYLLKTVESLYKSMSRP